MSAMAERFQFRDIRELFAKANEEKSGNQLAGLRRGQNRSG
jgi:ethanolamine ammonia-lyase large subunit